MNVVQETIDAVLDANGRLLLAHQPRLPSGPVRVTIRLGAATAPKRGLAEVIREIRADQIARGFQGLTAEELQRREAELETEKDEYEQEMARLEKIP
jgi:hypothetical protein